MPDELTIDTEREPVRRHGRIERTMSEHAEPMASVVDGPAAETITPEQAIADAQRIAAEKASEAQTERNRRVLAENETAKARNDRAREARGRVADRTAAVAAAKEAATADKQTAISAIKTARDAGDLDAELKGQDLLASANYRLMQTTGELSELEAIKEQEKDTPPENRGTGAAPANGGVSPAAQQWINAHPKFNSDPVYRQAALQAHEQALADGCSADSPAYFRHINAAVAPLEGGDRQDMTETGQGGNGGRRTPASSTGAPPSRNGGGSDGRASTVKTLLGDVSVSRRSDGKIAISIPPAIRADFEEAAKVNNMTLGDYAYEQVQIAQERARGGNAGLVTEEGSSYR